MTSRNVNTTFTADVSQFAAGIKKILADIKLLTQALKGTSGAERVAKFGKELTKEFERSSKALAKVQGQLKQIRAVQAKLQVEKPTKGQRFGKGTGPLAAFGVTGDAEQQAKVQKEINALRERERALSQNISRIRREGEAYVYETASRLTQEQQQRLGIAGRRLNLEQEIARITSGAATQEVEEAQLGRLQQALDGWQNVESALSRGDIDRLPDQLRKIVESGITSTKQAEASRQRILQFDRERIKLNTQLRKAQDETSKAALRRELDINASRRKTEQEQQQRATAAARRAQKRLEAQGRITGTAGDRQTAQEQQNLIRRLLNTQDVLGAGGVKLRDYEDRLRDVTSAQGQLANVTKRANISSRNQIDAQVRLDRQLARTSRKLVEVYNKQAAAIGAGGLPAGVRDPAAAVQGTVRRLGTLERTLQGAFTGFTRRFEATLQFAISGAILYGAQRLVREFVQAAIEVERAFADIETALEFDIDYGRGSFEFEQRVDALRLQVLALSNEFNVLPTEANKAAFVMVARFGETGNALKALRAQLLATKVSTIDQSEVLRALTAVAEGFASAVFEAEDSLSLQEKLLKREALSAELYAKALDLAVAIQQKFGIETEDVLEGTARATEVFRQLGFTMEETAGLVSAVVRQLGQTGVQAAERLVRSLGQINAAEIRDELLELARGSRTFQLTLADFAPSGANAWKVIADQFDRIQRAEPKVANAILQTLGQRREAEVVAAALGTGDFQKAIVDAADEAFGAAEARFSFLAATISERLKSITTLFQELAQNIERLGLFTPLKLLLLVLEQTLTLINTIIKVVDQFINSLNRIPLLGDIGLGEILKTFLSIGLVVGGLSKGLSAAGRAFESITAKRFLEAVGGTGRHAAPGTGVALTGGFLAANRALTGFSEKLKASGGGLRGLTVAAGTLRTAFAGLLSGTAAGLVLPGGAAPYALGAGFGTNRAMQQFLFGLSASRLAFMQMIPVLGAVTAGMLVLKEMADVAKKTSESLKELGKIPAEAAEDARAASLEEGLTPAETAARRYRYELERLEAQFQSGEHTLNWFEGLLATVNRTIQVQDTGPALPSLLPEVDRRIDNWLEGVRRWVADFPIGEGLLGKPGGEVLEDVWAETPLTEAWMRKRIAESNRRWAEAEIRALKEGIRELPEQETPGLRQLLSERPLPGFMGGQGLAVLNQLAQDLVDAETDQEVAGAVAAIEDFSAEWAAFEDVLNRAFAAIEGTIAGFQKDIRQLDRDVKLGRISSEEAVALQADLVEKIRLAAEDTRTGEFTQDEIDSAFAEYDDAMIALIDARSDLLEKERRRAGQIQDASERLRREAAIAGREIEAAIEATGWASERTREAFEDYMERWAEYARNENQEVLGLWDNRMSAALTAQQWVAAAQGKIDELAKQRDQAGAGTQAYDDFAFQILDLQRQIEARILDEVSRIAAANIRLAGPIQSKITQIKAEIDTVNRQISSGTLYGADLAEANVRLAELSANLFVEEFNAVAASIRAQAGVADTITKLNAELHILEGQLAYTATLMGANSAEYHNLTLQYEQIQRQADQAALELDIIAQKLASDLTDPLQQAGISLAETLAKLSEPSLGELERARLELEKAQRNDALIKAGFDAALFDLRFLYETDVLGKSGYIGALERLLGQVDTSTRQGKEIFLQIQGLIDGLADDVSGLAFNIPTSIRLPTLFEVRRALAADELGVNYQDNRQQDVRVYVSSDVDADALITQLDDLLGTSISRDTRRNAPGSAPLTLGVL